MAYTCSICMEDFEEKDNKNIFKFCNEKHIFCKKCFHEYVNKIHKDKPTMPIYETIPCPYCRKNISAEYLYAIYNKKEGLNITYHKNGQVCEEIYYKDGFVGSGPYKKYYDNGTIQVMYNYKERLIDGLYETNWLNGNPKQRIFYINGKKHGLSSIYYENGTLRYKSFFVNDIIEGVFTEYYSDGILKKMCTYSDGVKNGLYEEWDLHGSLKKREFYQNDIKLDNFYLG